MIIPILDDLKLQEVLDGKLHNDLLTAFIVYNLAESTVENILFYFVARDFIRNPTEDKFYNMKKIFIVKNSVQQVNLNDLKRNTIENHGYELDQKGQIAPAIEFLTPSTTELLDIKFTTRSRSNALFRMPVSERGILDAALLEIFKLMERDTFARFISTTGSSTSNVVVKSHTQTIKTSFFSSKKHFTYNAIDLDDMKIVSRSFLIQFKLIVNWLKALGFMLPSAFDAITVDRFGKPT